MMKSQRYDDNSLQGHIGYQTRKAREPRTYEKQITHIQREVLQITKKFQALVGKTFYQETRAEYFQGYEF